MLLILASCLTGASAALVLLWAWERDGDIPFAAGLCLVMFALNLAGIVSSARRIEASGFWSTHSEAR